MCALCVCRCLLEKLLYAHCFCYPHAHVLACSNASQGLDLSAIQFKEVNQNDLTYVNPAAKEAANAARSALGPEYAGVCLLATLASCAFPAQPLIVCAWSLGLSLSLCVLLPPRASTLLCSSITFIQLNHCAYCHSLFTQPSCVLMPSLTRAVAWPRASTRSARCSTTPKCEN